nr:hypothetical protein [Candidatus Sigynarchaeota archaeon]
MSVEKNENYITKIKTFLEEKNLKYEALDDLTLCVPYEIAGHLFKPIIAVQGKWIVCSCLIIDGKELPSDDKFLFTLFKKLLIAIHELPEINYDADENNSVYASVDMRAEITDFNNFFSEFFAVPYGV